MVQASKHHYTPVAGEGVENPPCRSHTCGASWARERCYGGETEGQGRGQEW